MRILLISLLMSCLFSAGLCAETDVNNTSQGDLQQNSADSNSSAADSGELLDIVGLSDANLPDGYIGGDAFNSTFTDLLKEYVDSQGRVNYSKLRRFRLQLNSAVSSFADIKPEVYLTWSRNEKVAFWINAYNLCTLKGIIDDYPIKPSRFMLLFYPANSIMHLRGLRDQTYFMIMGLQYTLEEIERDMLLGRFGEPRACFALCYGTLGGAVLRNEPYIGKVLGTQLDEQVKNYFARPDFLKIELSENKLYLSSVFGMYQWRKEAFLKRYQTNKLFRRHEPTEAAILNFVKDYISDTNAEYLKRREYTVEYLKYDWRLNEQSN